MNAGCASSMLHSFGPSFEHVTRLTLRKVAIHPSPLAMFVGHFPRLDNLSISVINILRTLEGVDDLHAWFSGEIVPTHPRGKFSTSGPPEYQVPKGVFETIILSEPRFHRVSLGYVNYDTWRDYWLLVEACAGSLEELDILAGATGGELVSISDRVLPKFKVPAAMDFQSRAVPTSTKLSFHWIMNNPVDLANLSRNVPPPSRVFSFPKFLYFFLRIMHDFRPTWPEISTME